MKRSAFKPARERIAALPEERRLAIEAHAAEVVEEMELAELRRLLGMTQADVAERSGMAQGDVSRFENADLASVRVSSLQRYARSLGAELQFVLTLRDPVRGQREVRIGINE